MISLCVTFMICLVGGTVATPLSRGNSGVDGSKISGLGLEFLGSTPTKELYITKTRTATFQYALGFGCPYVFENLTLAAIETLEEVQLIDSYFAATQSQDRPVEPVWTSGVDRLGTVRQWASTGKDIKQYPTSFQGDWEMGLEYSPRVADYNCVAIWRYCDRPSHGATIPRCSSVPHGTWFTPLPCHQERRFICERQI